MDEIIHICTAVVDESEHRLSRICLDLPQKIYLFKLAKLEPAKKNSVF